MATSLKTTNYGFGKYAADDVTSYLTDYNGTMDKIDTTIKSVQDIADEAKATGDANLNNISSLSQGLTATNKNVENLGKTQSAQQVEIENVNTKVSNLSIGEPTFGGSLSGGGGTGWRDTNITARGIAGALSGTASAIIAKGTYNSTLSKTCPSGTIGGTSGVKYLFEAIYITGNPFELTEGLKPARVIAFTNTARTIERNYFTYYEYASEANRTRIYIWADESQTTFGDDTYFTFIF